MRRERKENHEQWRVFSTCGAGNDLSRKEGKRTLTLRMTNQRRKTRKKKRRRRRRKKKNSMLARQSQKRKLTS